MPSSGTSVSGYMHLPVDSELEMISTVAHQSLFFYAEEDAR